MHKRPLAVVALLTAADYGLWSWSSGGREDVVALFSGLTLIPLLIAAVWMALTVGARVLSRASGRNRMALSPVRGDESVTMGMSPDGSRGQTPAAAAPDPRRIAA